MLIGCRFTREWAKGKHAAPLFLKRFSVSISPYLFPLSSPLSFFDSFSSLNNSFNMTLTDSQVDQYKDTFAILDKNKDGSICASDVNALLSAVGKPASNVNTNVNQSAFLELIKAHLANEKNDSEATFREAFALLDKNGDGQLSGDDLKVVMQAIGEDLTQQEIEDILREGDVDGDGLINYEEFVKIMMSEY
ncbi:uncharacterized protein VTP21DRAFT_4032 [Calcarisporiella thermophila]|uniref:uncharacterized protein n=1 Tax=Calcarisporiella thermophila TaxID=911321 RepID=UPI0037439FCE